MWWRFEPGKNLILCIKGGDVGDLKFHYYLQITSVPMAYKRKKGVSKRYVAKRRPMTKRKFRRMPRGSYKKRGKGKRSTVTVKCRSLSATCWIGNPVGSDYVAAYIKPWIGGTDLLADQLVYITNGAVTLNFGVLSLNNMNKYKSVFEYMYVSSMWIKYTPAVTQGSISTLNAGGGSVAGTLTMLPTNDLDKDKVDYPLDDWGLHSLKSNVRSTTFSIYKPCFMRWTPKLKIDAADGGPTITRYIPMKVQLDSDNWITGEQIGVIIQSQVPAFAGVTQSSLDPFAGGNWPSETQTAVIGKIEMGATCHFYGLRI